MTEHLSRPGVDLVLRLGETSAPRRCSMCDRDATHYVFTDNVYSAYVCNDHVEDAVEEAQA